MAWSTGLKPRYTGDMFTFERGPKSQAAFRYELWWPRKQVTYLITLIMNMRKTTQESVWVDSRSQVTGTHLAQVLWVCRSIRTSLSPARILCQGLYRKSRAGWAVLASCSSGRENRASLVSQVYKVINHGAVHLKTYINCTVHDSPTEHQLVDTGSPVSLAPAFTLQGNQIQKAQDTSSKM